MAKQTTTKPDRVWVSKWALTDGLEEMEVVAREGDGVIVRPSWSKGATIFLGADDWHDTRKEAVERAEFLRDSTLVYLDGVAKDKRQSASRRSQARTRRTKYRKLKFGDE